MNKYLDCGDSKAWYSMSVPKTNASNEGDGLFNGELGDYFGYIGVSKVRRSHCCKGGCQEEVLEAAIVRINTSLDVVGKDGGRRWVPERRPALYTQGVYDGCCWNTCARVAKTVQGNSEVSPGTGFLWL